MRNLLAVLRLFWRGDRRSFLAGIALSAVTTLAGAALLGLSGWFITASAIAGAAGAGLAFDFFRPSAGIRFLAIARTAGRYGERLTSHGATLKFLALLRVRLFRNIAAADFGRLGRFRSGEVLARLTADVDYLDNVYLRLFMPLIAGLATLGLVTLGLSLVDLRLGLATGGLIVVAAALIVGAGARAGLQPARRQALAREAIRLRAIDLSRGQTELLLAGRLGHQREAILEAHERSEEAGERLSRIEAWQAAGLFLTGQAALIAVLAVGAPLVVAGHFGAAALAMALLVAFGAIEAVTPLGRGALALGRTLLAAGRLAPLLGEPKADDRQADIQPRPNAATGIPVLALDGVSFGWTPGRAPILDRFSLVLMPGERVALTGPSGSGKSTVLALAGGLYPPGAGRVLYRGGEGARLARGGVGFLPQASALFSDTVAGNLRLADPAATDDDLWRALAIAGLDERVRALPGGLDAALGEGGQGLSGGELRRLALARLVVLAPAVFLLDEPTEGMGGELGLAVLTRLFASHPDAAFLYSTHREEEEALAERSTRIAGPFPFAATQD
jgi:ATP-binding cassette, subfamily C, bacterial CydC